VAQIFQGRLELQFRVKDQDYFLTFAEEEQRWYLVAASVTGLQRIPVYVDAAKLERFSALEKSAPQSRN
jgi:hypothetical protein